MADKKPKVSVIIPHWNGIDVLSECLNSLKKTNYNSFEIIVSDNASTDDSQIWIKKNHPDIYLIENSKNFGYAGGCNIGAKAASGEYLIFLNNDTVQNPDWIKFLVDRLDNNKKIAAAQPKILNYYKKDVFDYAGGSGGYMDIFCYPFARGRLFLEQEIDKNQYSNAQQCFWASGTALIVRKKIFLESGAFEEIFFSHMEEIDLCWRLQAMGHEIWVEPRSLVYHKNAVSLPMNSHKKYYLNHRNSLIMIFSNYSILITLYLGSLRLILELIACMYTLLKFDFNHFTGIVKSIIWILLHPLQIIKKRSRFKKIKRVSDKQIMRMLTKDSIVLQHYFFRKKTYLEIVSK
ncbi:glycosyltransferase family 2 protein [Candidatus Marinimicrobia bacterium]|nr:glycosyltransferase family 2 protein [Candidatus Neomarinimicrobiota bacterium]